MKLPALPSYSDKLQKILYDDNIRSPVTPPPKIHLPSLQARSKSVPNSMKYSYDPKTSTNSSSVTSIRNVDHELGYHAPSSTKKVKFSMEERQLPPLQRNKSMTNLIKYQQLKKQNDRRRMELDELQFQLAISESRNNFNKIRDDAQS